MWALFTISFSSRESSITMQLLSWTRGFDNITFQLSLLCLLGSSSPTSFFMCITLIKPGLGCCNCWLGFFSHGKYFQPWLPLSSFWNVDHLARSRHPQVLLFLLDHALQLLQHVAASSFSAAMVDVDCCGSWRRWKLERETACWALLLDQRRLLDMDICCCWCVQLSKNHHRFSFQS
ncbi:hypothetical protein VIGAN_05155900 [Vigna angularis var. angularis]|uniref:Uncharacterized protein n=1 Tax=Vigna angularis var. angularis TaxID=157739 RepID=A0A0S3S5M8_PHAAN|nr:hypothetical protein VIGAN_05155900 [Vigna angularis var. angularis]